MSSLGHLRTRFGITRTITDYRIDVFLLAQNKLLREGLGRLLEKEGDIRVVAAAAFDPKAIAKIMDLSPGVLVLEVGVLAGKDLRLVSSVLGDPQNWKIVMIGMGDDDDFFVHCLRAGAIGHVLRDASAADVIQAVRLATRGSFV